MRCRGGSLACGTTADADCALRSLGKPRAGPGSWVPSPGPWTQSCPDERTSVWLVGCEWGSVLCAPHPLLRHTAGVRQARGMWTRESPGMPGSSVPGACLWRPGSEMLGGRPVQEEAGRTSPGCPPGVVLLRHLASDVGRSAPASPRPPEQGSCPLAFAGLCGALRGTRPCPRSSACRPGGIPARTARPPPRSLPSPRFLGVGGGGTRPGFTPTMR